MENDDTFKEGAKTIKAVVPNSIFDELRQSCSFNRLSMSEQITLILQQYYRGRKND